MPGCSVLLLASVVSTLGGMVFGYELGIISGALLQLQAEFRLSCVQQEAVVSALLVGALLASVVGGCLIDLHGRRNSILLSNVLILAGSLLLLRSSYLTLVVGRIIVGFAMCISSMACCIFVSEMVTANRRGLLVTLYEAGITVGILAAYAMNYVLSDTNGGWKCMFGLAIVPTLVQFVSILFLPSSNEETSSHRDCGQTERSLMGPNGNQYLDDTEPSVNRLDKTKEYSIMHLFQRRNNMRTRTVIGLGLVMFQQFTGQPNVLFYACTIFQSVGFQSSASAVLASVGLGAVKVIATVISMMLADRVGRRPLLLGGCSVMSVCLISIGLLSGRSVLSIEKPCDSQDLIRNATTTPHLFLDNQTVFDNESHILSYEAKLREEKDNGIKQIEAASTDPVALLPDGHGRVVNWIILICMMAVVSAFSIGFGPMTWLVLSEIFPAGVRGRAFAFTNCFNWAANLIVTFSFLNVIDSIGLSGTFLLYGLTGLVAIVFFYFLLPETKGKSLEEIDKELSLNRIHSSEECCSFISSKITSVKYQRVHSQASSSGL